MSSVYLWHSSERSCARRVSKGESVHELLEEGGLREEKVVDAALDFDCPSASDFLTFPPPPPPAMASIFLRCLQRRLHFSSSLKQSF